MADFVNINRFPAGLLQFLELKTGGQTPRELSSVLQPTLEQMPFFLSGQCEVVANNQTLVPNNGTVELGLQAGVRFVCLGAAVIVSTFTAAGTYNLFLDLRTIDSGSSINISHFSETVGGTSAARAGFWFPRPWVMSNRDVLQGTIRNLTGGGTVTLGVNAYGFLIQN